MHVIKYCFLIAILFLMACQDPKKQETDQLLNNTFLQITDTVGYFGELRALPPPLSDDSLTNLQYQQRKQWHLKRTPFVIIDSVFVSPKRWATDLKAIESYLGESEEFSGFSGLVRQLYSADFEKEGINLTAFKDVGRYHLVKRYQASANARPSWPEGQQTQGDSTTFLSGRVSYSHVAFNKSQTKACFVVMVGYQAYIIENLILAEKQNGKWVIVFGKMLAVS